MKLIKIKTDHWAVVDDSEIKEGDFVYDTITNTIWTWEKYNEDEIDSKYRGKVFKITHSTQPLEVNNLYRKYDFINIKSISLQEVKELIGEVDVEKKVSEHFKNYWTKEDGTEMSRDEITADMMTNMLMETSAYNAGYNQALEDNKEKKYTEEDLKFMFEAGYRKNNLIESTFEDAIKFIQFLQPKTEWEVEIVDGKLKLK